ncbi:hypothetical protein [Lactobacillus kitasatonis]|uniref:hypothetical protein n=1 Tax=Lactobacillus kitasatonis TaxID=237446 RepID=UPI00046925A3|nr:hypothetical protein [Lactobacillus kitasatonis]
MDQNLREKVKLDERIRIYFVDAVIWDIFVGFANIYRPTSQKINKNAAQIDNFWPSYFEQAYVENLTFTSALKAGCMGESRLSFFSYLNYTMNTKKDPQN